MRSVIVLFMLLFPGFMSGTGIWTPDQRGATPRKDALISPEFEHTLTPEAERTITAAARAPEPLVTGLDDARSVRLSTLGHLFIVETGRNRILKISEDGQRLDSMGRLGSGPYQFDRPVAIDPTNEMKIYVSDRDNRRIQVFDRRLQYLSTIVLPRRTGIGPDYRPSLLAVDPSGRVYFFDEERHLVYRFDSNGQFDFSFELYSSEERIVPSSMAISNDELWVVDERGQLLHRFSPGGAYFGFIYAPEPVRSLRTAHNRLWILGDQHLMQINRSGEVVRAVALPDLPAPRRRPTRRFGASGWHSFDVRNEYAFLLDTGTLVRLNLAPDAGEQGEHGVQN